MCMQEESLRLGRTNAHQPALMFSFIRDFHVIAKVQCKVCLRPYTLLLKISLNSHTLDLLML